MEQRVLVIVKDAICFMKTWGNPRLAEVAPVDREAPCSMGRASRRATAIQAALRRRRAGDACLRRCSKGMEATKLDAVVYPSWNNLPHTDR